MKHLSSVLSLALVGLLAANVASAEAPPRKEVLKLAARVADWQLARLDAAHITHFKEETRSPLSWEQGAFWVGMTRLADASGEKRFREAILAQGRSNQWKPGPRLYHADDHVIAQSYLWAARNGAGAEAIAPLRATFDAILAKPAVTHLSFYIPQNYEDTACLRRWCWCDALFMSPPAWAELTRQTGDARYLDFALGEFWATTDFLYDPVEKLYFRDSRFFERRDAQGRKLFWSRGNGWVFAGLANLLDALPKDHPQRARLEALFREMAGKAQGHPETRRLLGTIVVRPGELAARNQRHGFLHLRTRLGREERPARCAGVWPLDRTRLGGVGARGGEGRSPRLGAAGQ